jgi:ribonucleoside-diphosphate reductase alpha chain
MSFAPQGMTDDPDIKTATSITDYIFRRLARDYLSFDDRLELGLASFEDLEEEQNEQQASLLPDITDKQPESSKGEAKTESVKPAEKTVATRKELPSTGTAPLCTVCGNITQRAGTCYVCTSCGATSGCS